MRGTRPPIHDEQKPVAVVYCYRATGSAHTHALSLGLWYQSTQLAFIEPVHCLGLPPAQTNLWLGRALRKLSRTYQVDLGEMIYSFTLDPTAYPLQPCSPNDAEADETLAQKEDWHGAWFNIWAYQRFYASLFATYAGISDLDAIELLDQLQAGGYVHLGRHIGDVLLVQSHAFILNRKRKAYWVNLIADSTKARADTAQADSTSRATHPFITYQQIWRTARMLRVFKLEDLLICAEVEAPITRWYLEQLYQVGYFHRIQTSAIDSDNEAYIDTYQLIRNSGPIPPLVCKSGVVYDINRNPFIYTPDGYSLQSEQ